MWKIRKHKDGFFILKNKTKTFITKHKQIEKKLIYDVINKLNELNVPLGYSDGVKLIRFTYLKSGLEGDYCNGFIRISCNNAYKDTLHTTMIHELAHHVDFQNGIYEKKNIKKEWKKKRNRFVHINIRKEPCEYVAIGFEKFYTEKKLLKKEHIELYKEINKIHRKYKRGRK